MENNKGEITPFLFISFWLLLAFLFVSFAWFDTDKAHKEKLRLYGNEIAALQDDLENIRKPYEDERDILLSKIKDTEEKLVACTKATR